MIYSSRMNPILSFPKELLLTLIDTGFYRTVKERSYRRGIVFLCMAVIVLGMLRALGFSIRYYQPLQQAQQEVVTLLSEIPADVQVAIEQSNLKLEGIRTPLSVDFTPALQGLFNPTGFYEAMVVLDPENQASESARAWLRLASDSAWLQTGTMQSRQLAYSELTGDLVITGQDMEELRTGLDQSRPWLVLAAVAIVMLSSMVSLFVTGLASSLLFGYVLKVVGGFLGKIQTYRQGFLLAIHLEVFALVATTLQGIIAPFAQYSIYMLALMLATSFVVVSLPSIHKPMRRS